MAAFARFSSSGASNDQAFQHDATPQSPKYIATGAVAPSGEVTLNAGELPGLSSLLGAARGGWDRRRLGGDTDSIQTAVKR